MAAAHTAQKTATSAWRFRLAAACVMLAFVALLFPYWSGSTGLTSLISIGEKSGPPVKTLAETPHHQFKDSWGYDGMQYAQLALHPTLRDPSLGDTVDNLPYRARRILMPWVAHLAGWGRPFWVLQAYALINIVCWFTLAFLLWRWLPADNWGNWFRWTGVLFSHGACMSVQMSLTDLPGMTLLLLALLLLERGRRGGAVAAMAAAVLCKETSLIAGGLLWEEKQGRFRGLVRLALQGGAMLTPFFLWLVYLRYGLGLRETQAAQNFSWPFSGLLGRWIELLPDLFASTQFLALKLGTLLSLVALTVQMGFLLLRWQPSKLWWRLGAPFAVLGLLVAAPVWEGYPGAATRVLLPMSLAFNLLVPRARSWLPILVLGNLSVFSAILQLRTTPIEFAVVRHEGLGFAPAWVSGTQGWHVDEANLSHRWRWTSGEGTLQLANCSETHMKAFVRGRVTAASERKLLLSTSRGTDSTQVICEQALPPHVRPASFQSKVFDLPVGGTTLHFSSDQQPVQLSANDPRALAFMIEDLEIVIVE